MFIILQLILRMLNLKTIQSEDLLYLNIFIYNFIRRCYFLKSSNSFHENRDNLQKLCSKMKKNTNSYASAQLK